MSIIEIIDINKKKEITNNILRNLPNWFGIEDAIKSFIEGVSNTLFLSYFENNQHIGFISLKMHFNSSYEIYVMGIEEKFHHKGIGSKLLKAAEEKIKETGHCVLQVKTLSSNRPDKYYDLTRKFYLKNGFIPLEEFPTLWDEANPCLLLAKFL